MIGNVFNMKRSPYIFNFYLCVKISLVNNQISFNRKNPFVCRRIFLLLESCSCFHRVEQQHQMTNVKAYLMLLTTQDAIAKLCCTCKQFKLLNTGQQLSCSQLQNSQVVKARRKEAQIAASQSTPLLTHSCAHEQRGAAARVPAPHSSASRCRLPPRCDASIFSLLHCKSQTSQ
jgi:hypothetical protein